MLTIFVQVEELSDACETSTNMSICVEREKEAVS